MTWTDALVEFVEKSALLRESIKRRGDEEHYEARVERMSKKLDALATALEETDAAAAAAVRAAWNRPVRTLAFRNAAHRAEHD
jgi:hypothetical protein